MDIKGSTLTKRGLFPPDEWGCVKARLCCRCTNGRSPLWLSEELVWNHREFVNNRVLQGSLLWIMSANSTGGIKESSWAGRSSRSKTSLQQSSCIVRIAVFILAWAHDSRRTSVAFKALSNIASDGHGAAMRGAGVPSGKNSGCRVVLKDTLRHGQEEPRTKSPSP